MNLARTVLAPGLALRPDGPALTIVDPAGRCRSWSFLEIDDAVRRRAAVFRRLAPARGGRVLLRLANDVGYPLAFLGANAAGLVPIPASAELTAGEVAALAADSDAAVVVAARDLPLPGLAARRVLGVDELSRLADACEPGGYASTDAEDPAFLVYTSGTSGSPKGVLHAQRVVVGRRPMHRGWLGLGPDDIVLHTGALNWTYTMGVGLLDPWSCGAQGVVCQGRRDAAEWPGLVASTGATILASVPGLYRRMLRDADLDPARLATLRHAVTAGEALPVPLYGEWRRRTGRELYEALGMSEISTYVSSGPLTPVRPGSPGRPQPGRRVAVLPLESEPTPLPPGEEGLLAVHRGDPGLMLGYWNRPDEEAAVYRGDWFVGGDLARFDEDGYLWFGGRADDLLNAGGLRVSPQEVEKALATHPVVAEVAVGEVEVASDVRIAAAFVVPRPGMELPVAELQALAEGQLAAYKRPRAYRIVQSLPRTANGKVVRKRLRELWPT
ncbi:MAG TPA: AMP-binding protein [Geminicoccaceae bacterium]|nr:AMP-binding protein [Geminicoccus sp.]HMU48516.1 AMP-binding protein [Geminicoccaceae bacterium]